MLTFVKRWVVRALVSFVFLVWFPTPLDLLPGLRSLSWFNTPGLYRPLVEVTAKVLSLELPALEPTGSGDTLADWLQLLDVVVLSAVISFLWAFDRKRTNDAKMVDAARDLMRLILALTMIGYGYIKLNGGQFPDPSDWNAWDSFADMSPMGLAWRFMGYSPVYRALAGAMELTGALLLLFRRTATLGALLLMVVMGNVVLMNFCFDIPVKQFSSLLLLFAVGIAWPDLSRLARAALQLGHVEPRELTPKYWNRSWGAYVVPLFILVTCAQGLYGQITAEPYDMPKWPPVAGQYFVVRAQGLALQWHQVRVSPWGVRAQTATGTARTFPGKIDDAKQAIVNEEGATLFTWKRRGPLVVLEGDVDGQPVSVELLRRDLDSSLLVTRPFNWVQEYPFNR